MIGLAPLLVRETAVARSTSITRPDPAPAVRVPSSQNKAPVSLSGAVVSVKSSLPANELNETVCVVPVVNNAVPRCVRVNSVMMLPTSASTVMIVPSDIVRTSPTT